MPSSQVKIRIDRASRIFLRAGVVAFEDLTLDLYEDEIACIVGPSGCGKTTLLRCIDGLLPLSHGAVLFDGRPVTGPPAKMAMVFQHFGLLPWRSVYANTAYGLKLAGAPPDLIEIRVSSALRLVELAGFERHYPYPAVRGNAAAGRPRPGAGDRPGRAADGRAFCRARRPDAGDPPRGDVADPGAGGEDDHLRYAQHRRGHPARRSGVGPAQAGDPGAGER